MSTLNNSIPNLKGLKREYVTRRSWAKVALTLAIILGLLAVTQPKVGHAQDQGMWPLIGGTTAVINAGPGDQLDPHISGTLVTYSSIVSGASDVRYHNLITGTDQGIPMEGGLDFLPDIGSSKVVYTHLTSGAYAIRIFDTSTGAAPMTLDPQPGSLRERPAIGGQTVAWVDYGLEPTPQDPEIFAYDLSTGSSVQLTDDLLFDSDPEVSPDGSLIVWSKCETYGRGCYIWQATPSNGGWSLAQLPTNGERHSPNADDRFIAYYGIDASTGEVDIYWREQGSTEEHRIALPDKQRNAALSNGIVVFESFDRTDPATPNWDIMIYNFVTGAGYRVTSSPVDEVLSDISVTTDGLVRVVYTSREADGADVYARTFSLPAVDIAPPSITINTPTGTTYLLNQAVLADYSCIDETGGSGLASCSGLVASGSPIDTTSVGVKNFNVTATDYAGNAASQVVSYTVTYAVCPLYDQGKAHKLGSTIPIKLQLCDANGANLSAAGVIVHAGGLTKLDNTASGDLSETSSANPDSDFRFDGALGGDGGYIYNLSSRGLSAGTWILQFTVSGDPLPHSVQFDLK